MPRVQGEMRAPSVRQTNRVRCFVALRSRADENGLFGLRRILLMWLLVVIDANPSVLMILFEITETVLVQAVGGDRSRIGSWKVEITLQRPFWTFPPVTLVASLADT